MPVPEPRLLPLREAVHRVADHCGVSVEEAKAALDRALREHSLVPFDSRFEAIHDWEHTVIDCQNSSIARRGIYTIERVRVFRQHVDDWMARGAIRPDGPFAANMLRAAAEAPMTTPQPWRFLEPYWDVRDVLGWLIDRDPKRFGRIFNPSDLRAATRYNNSARKDDNPTQTLLHAFQEGRLQAFRDGRRVPVEFWSTRSAANVRDDVDTRVRRNDVLALWPESWKWAQAVVWAVWRDEELVALCGQERLRYAQRGAERLRAGLRPAGSELDLTKLLRAGRITARGKREGDDGVNAIPAEAWPEWAGIPSGWREDEIAFDAGEMRWELPYVLEAQRPTQPFKAPDWVVEQVERRNLATAADPSVS
jgi:hypothetical protein